MPIRNGRDRLLTQIPGTMPDVSGALMNWFRTITYTGITKEVRGFNLVETETHDSFQGVITPYTPQQLQQRPEGQRKWRWWTIFAEPSLVLDLDDVIEVDSVKMRILSKSDFTANGYLEYHAHEDYQ